MIRILTIIIISALFSELHAQKTSLLINEIMASNQTVIADEAGKFEDWIEIFNPGNDPVDMGGMYISDDSTNPKKFRIPEGHAATMVPANGLLLLWADDDWEEGVLHLEIKLSKDGEFLSLYQNDGKTVLDSVRFGEQQTDVSYGRKTDGAAEWTFFEKPTPGTPNQQK